MKIVKIEEIDNVYQVTLEPTVLEKLFKIKPKIKKYIDSDKEYMFGGDIYIDETGEETSFYDKIAEEIDKYKNKKRFNFIKNNN